MAPTKQNTLSASNTFDGGVENLLVDNLTDANKKKGKRSFLFSKDPSERILEGVVNDDELERKRRKEEAQLLEKKNAEKSNEATVKPSPFNLLSNLTPVELEEHYTQCIRMYNMKKVNPKNAFKLQLIDYMKLILMTQNKKTENLSLMSCTLGASAKIYSCRVDKVYSDTLKIMSGKAWAADDTDNDDDGDDNKEDEAEEEATPKKKRKSSKQDKDDIPDFEKMLWSEARLDKSEVDNEFANYLNYIKTALPANAEYFLDCPLSETDGQLSLNSQLFCSVEISSTNEKVLKDFVSRYRRSFDSLDPASAIPGYIDMYLDTDEVQVAVNNNLIYDKNSHLIPESIRLEDETFGNHNGNIDHEDEAMIDYDDCMSDEDGVEPTPLTSNNSDNIGQLSAPKVTSFSVNGMSKLISARRSDYSFFDNNRLDFMAGPVHWSIKRQKNKPTSKVTETLKSTKKEGKIDFSLHKLNTLNKVFSQSTNAQLARKTMKTWCKSYYSSPVNVYNQRDVVSLFRDNKLIYLNNNFKYGLYENETENEIKDDESLSPEDFLDGVHGDREIEDNCDDMRDNDCDDNHFGDDHDEEMISTVNGLSINTDNGNFLDLIPAPPKVNKIFIKYAKAQKRVDIKRLKTTIWDYMELNKQDSSMEKKNNDDLTEISTIETIKLSDVFHALSSKLPEEEVNQLSFPIVFMAILHMANEKTLKLVGNEEFSDVTISLG